MTAMIEHPTSQDLITQIPHLTYRQLDWWIRAGYIPDDPEHPFAKGHGYHRTYSPAQVMVVRHMAHLTHLAGLTVSAAAQAAIGAEPIPDAFGNGYVTDGYQYRYGAAPDTQSEVAIRWWLPDLNDEDPLAIYRKAHQ